MESCLSALCKALERQKDILQEMFAAAQDHNHALRQNDLVALQGVTGREENIAARLKAEDRQREHWQAALGEKLELPSGAPLRKLLLHLPEAHSAELSRLADELRTVAVEIAGVVDLNRILTQQAMFFNEQLLRLLNPGPNSAYQPNGKAAPVGRSLSLINKTV